MGTLGTVTLELKVEFLVMVGALIMAEALVTAGALIQCGPWYGGPGAESGDITEAEKAGLELKVESSGP